MAQPYTAAQAARGRQLCKQEGLPYSISVPHRGLAAWPEHLPEFYVSLPSQAGAVWLTKWNSAVHKADMHSHQVWRYSSPGYLIQS